MEKEEAENTLSLKLLIDKHCEKVLFAEAGKDFVDFLFHIMTLPVGTVIRLLKPNDMVGCVGNLYTSIQNISDVYMESDANKEGLGNIYTSIQNISDVYMESDANKEGLLKPKSSSCGASFPLLLLPDSLPPSHKTYYKCSVDLNGHNRYVDIYGECSNSHSCCPNVADYPNATCPTCRRLMWQQVDLLEGKQVKTGAIPSSGYVKEVVTYMVMDNLQVKPMSTISSITMLNQFNVKDIGALEEKVIAIGMKEAVELLKTSLYSKNVLTDVFFGKV